MNENTPPDISKVELFAWLGEDELGSGEIGIKQALVPAGMIPLVATRMSKMSRDDLRHAMQRMASQYGKTVRLVRFVFEEVVLEVKP